MIVWGKNPDNVKNHNFGMTQQKKGERKNKKLKLDPWKVH